jgi:DNA-binding transcriptional regulator YiaG
MREQIQSEQLEKIKKKVESCDSIRYIVGQALFEDNAEEDMKVLISEVERCWSEIKDLQENLRLLRKAVELSQDDEDA